MQSGTFLILALACWRITSLVVYEQGPFDIFSKIRDIAGLEYDTSGNVTGSRVKILSGLGCVWCISIWVGLLLLGVYLLFGEAVAVAASLPFSLSMGAIVIDRLLG